MSRIKSQPLSGVAGRRAGSASLESHDVYVNSLLLATRGWISFARNAYENEMPLSMPSETCTSMVSVL